MSRFLNLIACSTVLFLGPAFEALSQPTAVLVPGQTYNGSLSSSDTSLDSGEYFQCFNLNVQPNQNIVVTLRSQQFDTTVAAGTGRCGSSSANLTLINDDFENTSTDSQVSFTTTQQEYIVAVTSYGPGETGNFTLIVEGPGGTTSNTTATSNEETSSYFMGTVRTGQQYSGTLTSNSLVLDEGQFVQCVDLDLETNQQTTVTLRSAQFDTQLFIGTGRCTGDFELSMTNDDFESNSRDSQLQFTPTQTQYMAVISSYGAGETGSYTLYAESGSGTQTTSTGDDTEEPNVGADYLLYGVIPNEMPEGMIFGNASGRQQTTEHTIQLPEVTPSFMMIAMCDFVNCTQISLTMIKPDGTEVHGNAITENSLGGVDILLTENLPAGTYRFRVNVPDCTSSCRYTLNSTY